MIERILNEKFALKPLYIHKSNSNIYIFKNKDDILAFEDLKSILECVMINLQNLTPLEELLYKLNAEKINIDKEELLSLLSEVFIKNNLLIFEEKIISDIDLNKFDRQIKFIERSFNKEFDEAVVLQKQLVKAQTGVGLNTIFEELKIA